jgi:hypothetical protein
VAPLYITTSQHIIRRRLHMAQIGVAEAREVVKRLALHANTVAELAVVAETWA